MDQKYISRTLTDNEELLLNFGYHWTRYMTSHYIKLAMAPHIFGVALGAIAFAVGVFLIPPTWALVVPPLLGWTAAIILWWRMITSDIHIVTNRRIIFKTGFMTRDTKELKLSAIEAITIKQGVWGRIFRVGTLTIQGRGGGTDLVFKFVSRPIQTKHTIENVPWRDTPEEFNTEESG